MKSAALFGLVALGATAHAAAVAEPSPEAWCTWVGQPCWKVKRVADAFESAIKESRGLTSADVSGTDLARRGLEMDEHAIRGLDDLAGVVANSQRDPRSAYKRVDMFPNPGYWGLSPYPYNFPTPTPVATKDKRNPEPAAQAGTPGLPLLAAKRAAEAIVRTIDGFGADAEAKKRDYSPLPVEARAAKAWCTWVGQPCWKRDENGDAVKREASPQPADNAPNSARWCTWVGQPCWKRDVESRCHFPGEACSLARRDLHAMYNAARNVLDMLE